MNIAELAIRKKTITLVMTVFLIGAGIICFDKLGRLEDPEYTIKEALVTTYYPGATPTEVAEEVTDEIETAIQQLPQLKRVKSISKAGVSIITVEIKDKYDAKSLPQVWDELRRKVNDVQGKLPPGVRRSIVADDFGDVYGILFSVSGKDYSYKELEEYADFLRRELLLVQDVAKVDIWGVQPQEVHVEISRDRMAQLGISLEQIYGTLEKQNLVTPAGAVRVGDEYIRIRPTGNFTTVKQIGELMLRSSTGNLIRLKDVATVEHGYKTPPDRLIRFNSEKSLVIGISVVMGGNVVTMGEAVKARLRYLEAQAPLGMKVDIITFQSDGVVESINSFVVSLAEALAIVVVVLMIFMGLRSGVLIGVTLLLTVLGTFVGMYLWGINLERISLGALIIALGMLVDNAIVINDGMLVRIEAGMERIRAAKEVVQQSAWPLLGATVIAILAFAAIGLSQDSTGEYTRSLFQVIFISLTLSWIIAVTVTPLLCVMFLKVKKVEPGKTIDPYGGLFYEFYRAVLRGCLRLRWLTIAVLLGMLGTSIYGFGFLEDSFFPDSSRPQFMVHYWMPQGTDIRRTNDDLFKFEEFVRKRDGVSSVATFVGEGAPRFLLTYSPEKPYSSYGFMMVNVKDYREINRLMSEVQQHAKTNFIDAITRVKRFVLGPGTEDPLEARFSGPDPTVLRALSEQAKQIMRKDGNIYAIKDDWRERVKVIRPQYAEDQARRAGITKSDLDNALEMNFSGINVGVYRQDDKLLPILSRAPESERFGVENIKDAQIWSRLAQVTLPIRQVVSDFKTTWEDAVIHRRDRRSTVTTQGTQITGNASVVFERIRPKIENIKLPIGYELEWGGEHYDSQTAQVALMGNLPVAGILVVLILIMLFNSLRQPLIILLTVPLAIIGVTIGLLATGQSFGFMALLGFLSLAGMLIKNAVVLIDQIDLEIREGKEPYAAIIDSSVSRMRPVAMAAVTTVLGMTPLLFDIFFVGMAVTIMAGLTFATVLTLVVVPVLYAIFFRISEQSHAKAIDSH